MAFFRITVVNRDYHYLSQFEIDGAKRIYQHLSAQKVSTRQLEVPHAAAVGGGAEDAGTAAHGQTKNRGVRETVAEDGPIGAGRGGFWIGAGEDADVGADIKCIESWIAAVVDDEVVDGDVG